MCSDLGASWVYIFCAVAVINWRLATVNIDSTSLLTYSTRP